jgi:microcin C transport system permease protein
MWHYFLRRLLLLVPTLLGISMIVFLIMHLVPGGPVEQMMLELYGGSEEEGGAPAAAGFGAQSVPADALEEMRKAFGFDKPWYVRYFHWLWRVLHLDFGKSYRTGEDVWHMISSRFPVSIYFGLIGFVLAYLVCIPLGVLKAVRHGSTFDVVSSVLVFIGYSVPGWALGLLLLVLFGGGSFWNVFPLGKFRSAAWDDLPSIVRQIEDHDAVTDEVGDFQWEKLSFSGKVVDQLHHTVLPVFCYMLGSFASLTVLMKNSVMENIHKDFVRTAFAKGLSERRVIFVHVLRNSLIPLATGLGHAIGLLMAGSYLIEKIFDIDGMGRLGYMSLLDRDYPVALGILMISAILTLLGNILSDMLYAAIDPRIRFA